MNYTLKSTRAINSISLTSYSEAQWNMERFYDKHK
jgi:hypothetical protein